MATRRLHASEVLKMLPRSEVDERKIKLSGICFRSWQARKHAPKELTPSLSGSALRGRLASAWCEKARGALLDFHGLYFDNEWKAPLRFFIPMIDEERSGVLSTDRSAGDCGEKSSLLLLAFSPFHGEHVFGCRTKEEQGRMRKLRSSKHEIRYKFEMRRSKCEMADALQHILDSAIWISSFLRISKFGFRISSSIT